MGKLNDRQNAIIEAVACFALTKYFPHDETTRGAVMDMLDQMCDSPESIVWVGHHIRDHYTEWPGAAIVRGVYCTRYRPLDGGDGNLPACDPTYREVEQRTIAASEEYKALPGHGLAVMQQLALPEEDAEGVRRRSQSAQWNQLCAAYPVPRVFRSLSMEFATADTTRRSGILAHIKAKLARISTHIA